MTDSCAPAATVSPRIVLLGRAEVRSDRRLRLQVGAMRLLAFLAVRGPSVRSVVASELWPRADGGHAAGCLRTALWRMQRADRRLLSVSASADLLGVAPGVPVDLHDVTAAALAVLTGAGGADDGALAALMRAETLLPGWDDDWVVAERERQRQLRLHALEALADRWSQQGRFGPALEAALAAVRIEPLRESAHRAVIRAHVAEGNLAEATRQYDALARLLSVELGVPPAAETRRLVYAADGRIPDPRTPGP